MVHLKARVRLKPAADRGALVGAVVVADQVHVELLGHLAVDLLQELLELDRAVAPVQRADHGPVGGIERGEQARGPVAQVVMGALLSDPGHHRKRRLRTRECLHLAVLVDAQHDRGLGRVQVQADDVVDLLHEQRVGGQLERLSAVRLELKRPPDPADR